MFLFLFLLSFHHFIHSSFHFSRNSLIKEKWKLICKSITAADIDLTDLMRHFSNNHTQSQYWSSCFWCLSLKLLLNFDLSCTDCRGQRSQTPSQWPPLFDSANQSRAYCQCLTACCLSSSSSPRVAVDGRTDDAHQRKLLVRHTHTHTHTHTLKVHH